MRTIRRRLEQDGISHVDQDQIAALALAALAVTGTIATSSTQAEAKPLHWGIGAGLVGAAIVGTAIAASDGYYYDGYRRCGWVRQYDAFGRYMGRVRTCNFEPIGRVLG